MIPSDIHAVDVTWLSQVMGTEVTHFELNQIGQGVGIMGDIFRTTLTYAQAAENHPASVVIKLPSSFPENREQGVALGMFNAEVRFYKELAGRVTTGLPAIYHAEIDAAGSDFVIVMEDLCDLQMVNQSDGLEVDQAHAALNVLGKIHAAWWDDVEGDDVNWIAAMNGPRIEFVDSLMPAMLAQFREGFAQYLPPGGLEVYELFTGNYLKLTSTMAARSPWTLVHQDFRVENMMFAQDGSERVVVIDWQGIGRGPGAYDVAYILSGSMDTKLRQANEPALLDTYLNSLQDAGVTNYSSEQLQQDYALSQFMGGLATSMFIGGGLDLSNERGVALCATMSSRHVQAAIDHGGVDFLQSVIDAYDG